MSSTGDNGPLRLLQDTLTDLVANPRKAQAYLALKESLPAEQKNNLDAVLTSSRLSYRDGVVIQLAFGLSGYKDLTERHPGGRTVAGKLGRLLADLHIRGVRDAFQNIGKNTINLARGNFAAWDEFLKWATNAAQASDEQAPQPLDAAFKYACARIALSARPVEPMPELDVTRLSFAAVMGVVSDLLAAGSQGAYEQFSVAAFLHGLVQQSGLNYRVETKSLHASDRSSRAAGDVQILTGNRVIEAFEVTANPWIQKLPNLKQTLREHDLTRLHVIGRVSDFGSALERLGADDEDVSVLPIEEFLATLVASLTRGYRSVALMRLYELLDRYQPDVIIVNNYVNVLRRNGLAVAGSPTSA